MRHSPFFTLIFSLCAASAASAAPVADASGGEGWVVAIGGALKADNAAVWGTMVARAGGKGARWIVLATASGAPEAAGRDAAATLARHGALAEVLPVSPLIGGRDVGKDARDRTFVERIDEAQGVFFTGGAQERIGAALLNRDGGRTPLLQALFRLYRRGGVVAGTSAGAAAMPRVMIRDIADQLSAMREGVRHGRDIDRGLGFAPADLFIDQHCLKRGRIGRMLAVMAAERYSIGACVEENAAAFIRGGLLEAVGAAPLLLVDLRGAIASLPPLAVRGAVAHLLDASDRYDLVRHRVEIDAGKTARRLDHTDPRFVPYYDVVPFHTDMLGDRAIANAMATLLDSKASEAHGLAFRVVERGGAKDEAARIGFLFRLYKREGTHGYASKPGGEGNYSIVGMGLDVLPVTMNDPLFTPLADAPGNSGENASFANEGRRQ